MTTKNKSKRHWCSKDCDDCGDTLKKQEEIDDTGLSIENSIRQQTLKEVLDYLQKNHLDYCKEQNGLPYCKNCGLSIEDIIKHFKIKL